MANSDIISSLGSAGNWLPVEQTGAPQESRHVPDPPAAARPRPPAVDQPDGPGRHRRTSTTSTESPPTSSGSSSTWASRTSGRRWPRSGTTSSRGYESPGRQDHTALRGPSGHGAGRRDDDRPVRRRDAGRQALRPRGVRRQGRDGGDARRVRPARAREAGRGRQRDPGVHRRRGAHLPRRAGA